MVRSEPDFDAITKEFGGKEVPPEPMVHLPNGHTVLAGSVVRLKDGRRAVVKAIRPNGQMDIEVR